MPKEIIRDHKPSICFVAHNGYGAISGRSTGHIGGIERQQSLMARWLAQRGYRVSMLTWDEGQQDGIKINGVRVFKVCRQNGGLPGLRFVHPKWTALARAMARADADVYYQNCGECVTGQIALWCRRHGRKFVYSVASDPDVDPALPEMKTLRERVFYRYGLRRAQKVIVQTACQHRKLLEHWNISSVVIPMPCLIAGADNVRPEFPTNGTRARILWIGRIGPEKRLEWLFDTAGRCPDLQFDVVGHPHADNSYSRQLMNRGRGLANVTMHGYVPYQDVSRFYRQATLLCCTSVFEGFPNTFLEAWSQGLPVVSTFDPDSVVVTRSLGVVAGDVDGLAAAIHTLLNRPDQWRKMSVNARQYYLNNHTVDVVMPRFEQTFLETFRGEGSA